jgi:RNA polymerase sigma-70 factor (ECF subfamily)
MQSTIERVLAKGVPENVDVLRWMYKVCRNLWVDELRAKQVRQRAHEQPELREATVSGEDVVIGELTLRDVERALANLPHEQRAVLALVAVEGLSYRETAAILDTPIGTVMSRLARARAAVAQHFQARGTERRP